MALKTRLTTVDDSGYYLPLSGSPCQCLAEFFREEFARHRRVLEQQREYFSDRAIEQAEDALSRVMSQIEQLCQRPDACEVIGQLLRKLDLVTNLSAWSEPRTLH
ncbi:MAG: hypothetical protein R2752_13870 [Vicinamibacterales bacterium]